MNDQANNLFADVEDFIALVFCAYEEQGYDVEVYREEGFPLTLSVVCNIKGDEVAFNGMLLPMDFLTGDTVKLFQIYYTLFTELPESDFDRMEKICNHCNTNIAMGTFGMQRTIGAVCYKHTIPLRVSYGTKAPLAAVLDTTILTKSMVEWFYEGIKAAVTQKLTLEQIMEQALFPGARPME